MDDLDRCMLQKDLESLGFVEEELTKKMDAETLQYAAKVSLKAIKDIIRILRWM